MKLRIVSDLHWDHYAYKKPMTLFQGQVINEEFSIPVMEGENEQTLILAGDVVAPQHFEDFKPAFEELSSRFKHVIIVMGNHDYWKNDLLSAYERLRKKYEAYPNVVLLEKESIVIDDVAIFGATLWTSFNNADPYHMGIAERGMNDYWFIKKGSQTALPQHTLSEHLQTIVALKDFAVSYPTQKRVVITHHCPSPRSIHEKWRGHGLNYAYVSDLEDIIKEVNPLLWVHGHVHNGFDYMVGDTRVLCNPHGYWGENQDYDGNLVVEV